MKLPGRNHARVSVLSFGFVHLDRLRWGCGTTAANGQAARLVWPIEPGSSSDRHLFSETIQAARFVTRGPNPRAILMCPCGIAKSSKLKASRV